MSDEQIPGTDPALATGRSASSHPVLVYTALRILLLVGVAVVLYLVGLRGIWLLMLAFLVSGVISMVALNRRREVATSGVISVVQKVNTKIDSSARAEDAAVDAAASSPSAPSASTPPSAPSASSRREAPADDDLDDFEPVDDADPRP